MVFLKFFLKKLKSNETFSQSQNMTRRYGQLFEVVEKTWGASLPKGDVSNLLKEVGVVEKSKEVENLGSYSRTHIKGGGLS